NGTVLPAARRPLRARLRAMRRHRMSLWSRWLSSWGFHVAGRRPIRARRPVARYAPRCEPLEDRCVPAISLINTPGAPITLGVGVPMSDSASLSGGVNPTGYILFQLNAPGGGVVNEQVVGVTGNGTYTTPNAFLPTGTGALTGTYQWSASYSGDAN